MMEEDLINSPSHYRGREYEAIDIIDKLGIGAHGSLKDVITYLLRYHKKNGIEDLKKANWFLNRLIDVYYSCVSDIKESQEQSTFDFINYIDDFDIPSVEVRSVLFMIMCSMKYEDEAMLYTAAGLLSSYISKLEDSEIVSNEIIERNIGNPA